MKGNYAAVVETQNQTFVTAFLTYGPHFTWSKIVPQGGGGEAPPPYRYKLNEVGKKKE